MQCVLTAMVLGITLLIPPQAQAEDRLATLTVDGLSFLSFDDVSWFSIPQGSTLRFRFGDVDARGFVPFTIAREDVSLRPVKLASSRERLRLEFALPAKGVMRRGPNGRLIIEFNALVRAQLDHPTRSGAGDYSVRFTTEHTVAHNDTGTRTLRVSGQRIDEASRSIQLVGTSATAVGDYPRGGGAVYAVLSGTFDRLPTLP